MTSPMTNPLTIDELFAAVPAGARLTIARSDDGSIYFVTFWRQPSTVVGDAPDVPLRGSFAVLAEDIASPDKRSLVSADVVAHALHRVGMAFRTAGDARLRDPFLSPECMRAIDECSRILRGALRKDHPPEGRTEAISPFAGIPWQEISRDIPPFPIGSRVMIAVPTDSENGNRYEYKILKVTEDGFEYSGWWGWCDASHYCLLDDARNEPRK